MDGGFEYTYRVRRKASYDSDYTNIAVVSKSSYTDSNLQPNTTYKYYIDVLKNGSYCVHSETVDVTTNEQFANQIILSTNEIAINPGQNYQLYATISPFNTTNKSVKWTSANTDVAEVSHGNVAAKNVGTALITTETSNGITASCTVTVDTLENLCDHSYGEWIETKSRTCTDNGERTRTCSKCWKAETEVLQTEGHKYSTEWTTVTDPTCSTYGTKKHLCTVCGTSDEVTAETIDMTEHSAGDEWIIDKEATCSEIGEQHKICNICGEKCEATVIPVISHKFDNNWNVEQTATCQKESVESRVCSMCNEKEYRYKEKVEHEYKEKNVCDATTSEEGTITYTCTYCNEVITEIIPIISAKPEVSITNAKAQKGSDVDIIINLVDNPGIVSAKMQISYDSSVMTLQKVTDAGVLGTTSHSPLLNSPYTLYWNNGAVRENYITNGKIVTLTFNINSNAVKGIYPISIEFTDDDILDVNLNSVLFAPSDGFIEVIDSMIGDINGDKKINVKDNMILSRYIAEWPGYTSENLDTTTADINSDGKINVKDDMILSRHIAEWPGYEVLPYLN